MKGRTLSKPLSSPVRVEIPASAAAMPWEDRPEGCSDVLWRYSANPVIPRDAVPCANSIFNSAAVRFGDAFAGVFRVDDRCRRMRLHAGRSVDAINWDLEPEPLQWIGADPEVANFEYAYDPRVCWFEEDQRFYVTWCNGYHGPTIGVGWTTDFKTFHQMENAYVPFNRNGVMFPRKINGKYVMLNRPSDNGHTPFGEIYLSQSPDMVHWGCHRHVMATRMPWESTKIGAGPIPIETDEGWLMIYHGVLNSCNGFVYSMGAALLDLDEPWKVRARATPYLLSPQRDYECEGDVPNVAFPCAALADLKKDQIAIYYGGADTVTCLAFGRISEISQFVLDNAEA